MRTILFLVVTLGALLSAGCATLGESAAASNQPHAECLVCKKNADLACVDLALDTKTPRYLLNDTTYYFCSDACKNKFIADPQKYVNGK